MASIAVLSRADIPVVPGEETILQVTVRNTGSVVDEFMVEPLGDAAGWMAAEPAVLPLYPGAEGEFTVRVRPPRAATTAPGPVDFGLRVRSSEDPDGTVVEEGVLEVAGFAQTGVELLPRTSRARGRGAGRHDLAIDNRGNGPLTCTFSTVETDGKTVVDVSTLSVVVPPGEAAFVPVKVRATTSFWRGPAVSHPFQVYVEPGSDPNIAVDGTFVQEAILPRWLPKALAALLALLLVLTALWFAVLKPTIKDTATEAAEKAAEAAAVEAIAPVAAAQQTQQRQIEAVAAGQDPSTVVPVEPGATTVDPLGNPTAVRLTNTKDQKTFTVPEGQAFSLTDLMFQNPNGDSGIIRLLRGSQILFDARLDNFRDLDQHFVAPLTGTAGQVFKLDIICEAPSKPDCTPAVLLSGFLRPATPAS